MITAAGLQPDLIQVSVVHPVHFTLKISSWWKHNHRSSILSNMGTCIFIWGETTSSIPDIANNFFQTLRHSSRCLVHLPYVYEPSFRQLGYSSWNMCIFSSTSILSKHLPQCCSRSVYFLIYSLHWSILCLEMLWCVKRIPGTPFTNMV